MTGRRAVGIGLLFATAWALGPEAARAQATPEAERTLPAGDEPFRLDFNDVELSVVIDAISQLTGKNFIYDERVRGRVTIVSPTKITVDQAYAVFESVLQVKGFTTVVGPGGVIKVIPIRDAKESNIETGQGRRAPPESDRYITRLIPLHYIDAEAISNTLKPLVSKDAAMVAYAPTNTVILTDAATNIQRLLTILEAIDVETYKEQLEVLKIRHADAATLADQLSEIFDAEVSSSSTNPAARRNLARRAAAAGGVVQPGADVTAPKGAVRIITDERSNSLIVLTSRSRLEEIRDVVAKLDIPVTGGGRIHVHYLKYADAEELAATLSALISGTPTSSAGGGGAAGRGAAQIAPQTLRAAVSELAEGITVTADPPTNSLVIQASQEGYSTLKQVIALLDIARPQVLVEALIMEVDVSNGEELGFSGIVTLTDDVGDGTKGTIGSVPGAANATDNTTLEQAGQSLLAGLLRTSFIGGFTRVAGDTTISAVLRAAANDSRTNIISAPHILTSDNEEAEIKIGNNIPIITSRVQQPTTAGLPGQDNAFNTSANIERQDIGVTLRVTPQISEGATVRLEIFEEIKDLNDGIQIDVGSLNEVGPALSNRTIENTVVVNDGETVVIGGLISDNEVDQEGKVPYLGDIPILGWFFKSTSKKLTKQNLLLFLTPHIIRSVADLEEDTIRKREEFWERSEEGLQLSDREQEEADQRREEASAAGLEPVAYAGRNPVRGRLLNHAGRYPVERMAAIEREREEQAESARQALHAVENAPRYGVIAAVFRDERAATELLQQLVDAGYDGALLSSDSEGTVLLELRLGPYESMERAQQVAANVRQSFALAPTIVVEPRQP